MVAVDRAARRGRPPPRRADRGLAVVGRPAARGRVADRAGGGGRPARGLHHGGPRRGRVRRRRPRARARPLARRRPLRARRARGGRARARCAPGPRRWTATTRALERVASPEAVAGLLYGGDATRGTRLVVRGPRVKRIRIAAVQVEHVPATMTIDVELGGRRYVEDRDTAAVVSGSKDCATTFTERWTLALDGPDDAPWRIVVDRVEPRVGSVRASRQARVRGRDLRRRHRAVRALRAPVRPPVPRGPARVGADRGRHRHGRRDRAARRGALVHARGRVLGGRPGRRGRDARDRSGPLEPHRRGRLAGRAARSSS